MNWTEPSCVIQYQGVELVLSFDKTCSLTQKLSSTFLTHFWPTLYCFKLRLQLLVALSAVVSGFIQILRTVHYSLFLFFFVGDGSHHNSAFSMRHNISMLLLGGWYRLRTGSMFQHRMYQSRREQVGAEVNYPALEYCI